MKNIAIVGSTGHVGQSVLEIISKEKKTYNVFALCCNKNIELLQKQIGEFSPKYACVHNKQKRELLKSEVSIVVPVKEVVTNPEVDLIVFSQEGTSVIELAFLAAKAKINMAFANKDIFLSAGEPFMELCKNNNVELFYLDNEHCAMEQCLVGEEIKYVKSIALTASGGPFFQKGEMPEYYDEELFTHPTYRCGKISSVNSATLMNKGQELIAAKFLFDIDVEKIEVVIHPQSIVQAMIAFDDGCIKAVLATPDVKFPLQYSLFGKNRKNSYIDHLSFDCFQKLEFFPFNKERYGSVELCKEAIKSGGSMPSYLNAINEVLVERFCEGELSLREMKKNLEKLICKRSCDTDISLEAIMNANFEGKMDAREVMG